MHLYFHLTRHALLWFILQSL